MMITKRICALRITLIFEFKLAFDYEVAHEPGPWRSIKLHLDTLLVGHTQAMASESQQGFH